MLARLYHRVGMGQKAIEVLEGHTTNYPEAADLTDSNILAELYIEGEQYDRAAALIRHAEQRLCVESGLPIDLTASTRFTHPSAVKTVLRDRDSVVEGHHRWMLPIRAANRLQSCAGEGWHVRDALGRRVHCIGHV